MSGDDEYDRRREEARFYDRRYDQMRSRYEEGRRRTRSIIDGMRTGDYRGAYSELGIPPSDPRPPISPQLPRYADEADSLWSEPPPAWHLEIPPLVEIAAVRSGMDDVVGVPKKALKRARKAAARQAGSHFAERFAATARTLKWLRRKETGLRLYKEVYANHVGRTVTLAERLEDGPDFSDTNPEFEATYRARKREIEALRTPLEAELRSVIGALLR